MITPPRAFQCGQQSAGEIEDRADLTSTHLEVAFESGLRKRTVSAETLLLMSSRRRADFRVQKIIPVRAPPGNFVGPGEIAGEVAAA